MWSRVVSTHLHGPLLVLLFFFALMPAGFAWAGVNPIVTLSSADTSADEAGPDGASFTVTRDTASTTALSVNLSLTGTAARNVDYQASGVFGGSPLAVSIPANQTSVTINLTIVRDNVIEGQETIDVALQTGSNYDLGATTSEQITIADSVAEVTLTSSDSDASEQGQDIGSFIVTRTNAGNTSQALTVNIQIVGTATRNVDYSTTGVFGGSPLAVSIPANMLQTTLVITPLLDNLVEGTETVDVQIQAGSTYTIGMADSTQILIADDVPEVSISAADTQADERGQDPGSFTVSRTNAGNLAQALSVNLQVLGTAQRNIDYSLPGVFGGAPLAVSIPANTTQATFTLTPFTDNNVEGDETAEINLQPDASRYVLGATTQAVITIADDVPEINLTVLDGDASEAGSDPGQIRVSRTVAGNLAQAVSVSLSVLGTAQRNIDYQTSNLFGASPVQASIPANMESILLNITPVRDNFIEGDETVEFTLLADPDTYVLGSDTQGTVTIADDVAEVSLNVINDTASEAGLVPATVEVQRTNAGNVAQALTVNLTLAGTAQRNIDYTVPVFGSSPITVSIPANQLALILDFTPRADAPDNEGDETILFGLATGTGYVLGGTQAVTLTLADLLDALFADSFEAGVTSKRCDLDQEVKSQPLRFTDRGPTVVDQVTGLTWTRCGLTGVYDAAASACRQAPKALLVDPTIRGFNAGLAGDNAGFSQWRQPNLHDRQMAGFSCTQGLLVH